ncbi:MAG: GldG family protein [Elusimicrobia bacterium]|nr:GldG family protein [Elusimicrobiota bacterium]
MEARLRRRALLFSWAGAGTVLAALAAANLLSYVLFARADLSANQAYSISRGTKDLLRGLQDTLTVKAYYTAGLPPPYSLDRQYLRDLLAEYKSAGRGRVRMEFISPEGDRRRREALAAGVEPLRLSVASHDKFEVKESFMGVVLLYRGKTEVIPVLNGVADLEYELTRRIKKLSSASVKAAGFVTGHGEAAPGSPAYEQLFSVVSEQMDARAVSLDQPLPAGLAALWIWGPTSPFKPAELERLKGWLASGGSLGLLLSRREVDLRSFRSRPNPAGLEAFLAQWGLDVADGLVVDAQCEKIQMEQPYGPFRSVIVLDYPFIPVATRMDRGHPAVRGLEAVSFPFASPIRFQPEGRTGLTYTSLVDSGRTSWLRSEPSADPTTPIEALVTKAGGPFSLAGVLQGDFAAGPASTGTAAGRLLIVGTAQQVRPQFVGKQGTAAFLLNLLEWSLQDESLLSIRSKAAAYRPLGPLPLAAMLAAKYALIFLPPLALVALGVWRYRLRKAQRRRLARDFDDA